MFERPVRERIQKGVKHYGVYVAGIPAGTCTVFSLANIGGYSMWETVKEYRQQGIGTTLTVHALKESINERNDLHTLQTTKEEMAEQRYKEIGVTVDYLISYYIKKV